MFDVQVYHEYFFSFLISTLLTNGSNITSIDQYVIEFVRQLRIKKNLVQADIAGIMEVERSFVSNVESPRHRAKYNLTHINSLAFYFDMSPRDFLPAEPFDPALFSGKNTRRKINRKK